MPITSSFIAALFTGFVFTVNLIMGTGGLALPLAYAKAGSALGAILMGFCAFAAYVTLGWHLEAQVRAFVLARAYEQRLVAVCPTQPLSDGGGAEEGSGGEGAGLSRRHHDAEDDDDDGVVGRVAAHAAPVSPYAADPNEQSQGGKVEFMAPGLQRVNSGHSIATSVTVFDTDGGGNVNTGIGGGPTYTVGTNGMCDALLPQGRVVSAWTLAEAVERCRGTPFTVESRAAGPHHATSVVADFDEEVTPESFLEVIECLRLFAPPIVGWVWMVALVVYTIGTLWVYTTVLAESALLGMPLAGYTTYQECHPFAEDPSGNRLPMSDRCNDALKLYVLIFSSIVGFLVMRDWRLMPVLQKIFTVLMYVILVVMICTSIAGLYDRPYCVPGDETNVELSNGTTVLGYTTCPANTSTAPTAPFYSNRASEAFDFHHFADLFGKSIFAMLCHTGTTFIFRRMPGVTLTKTILKVTFVVVFFIYAGLALTVSLYLGDQAKSLVTINWAYYDKWGPQNGFSSALGGFVLFFPVFSVTAAYIITLRAGSDAIEFMLPLRWRQRYCELFGRTYVPFNAGEGFSVWPLQFSLRLALWGSAVALTYISTNFSVAVSVTSLFGFVILFVIPAACQFGSRHTLTRAGIDPETPVDDVLSGYAVIVFMQIVCAVSVVYYVVASLIPTVQKS